MTAQEPLLAEPMARIAPAPPLPTADRSELLLDFDGTITSADMLDELVARFAADDSWKELERRWQACEIGSRECLGREFDLLRVSAEQLEAFLQTIELDPGVERLFTVAAARGVPLTIVSDGVDRFIEALLARLPAGVRPPGLAVRANAIEQRGDRLKLLYPHIHAECAAAAAHCKCRSAALRHAGGRSSIYIGDGLSDLCPARKAGAVFAKGRLAAALAREGIGYHPFHTLKDVAAALERAWDEPIISFPTAAGSRCRKAAP